MSEPRSDSTQTQPTDTGDTGRPVVPDYFVPDESKMVTLQSMPPLEAELACAKLEAEGVSCFITDANSARVNPLWNIPVRLQVRQDDVERAREILARPPEDVADDEYVEEEWRCPKCRRKALDFLPLTPARRRLRDTWIALLLLPFVWWLIPFDQAVHIPEAAKSWAPVVWFAVVAAIAVKLVTGKRGKRCRECGWMKPA